LEAYVVGVGEEAHAGDNAGTNMIPSKRSLVDLGQSQTTTLIGILNVSKVIVKVVKGIVASVGQDRHRGGSHGGFKFSKFLVKT
jgi:hypothetical protein